MTDIAKQLPHELLKTVRNVIDGNQVKADELKLIKFRVEPFNLKITIDWEFYASWSDKTIAGGRASSNHFGYHKSRFQDQHNTNLKIASEDASIRQSFLGNLKKANVQGLLQSKQTYTILDLGTHSYSYDCTHCNARGNVRCHNCGGSGRKSCIGCGGSGRTTQYYTQYDSYSKQNISRQRQVTCGSCGGSGSNTCYTCHGSGSVTCPSCNGQRYFTLYRHTEAKAKPSAHYYVTCEIYASEIANSLVSHGIDFSFEKVLFTSFKVFSPYTNIEQFQYYGNSLATEINTDLRGTNYIIAGYSNPPYPFIRPPIFDQLFKEEIAELQTISKQKGKARKKMAVKFFDHFMGQPVLNEALMKIAKNRTSQDTDSSHIIRNVCHDFISTQASQAFSAGINAVLDKVSPPYHGLTWWIWYVISGIVAFILTEASFERVIFNDGFGMIGKFLYCLLGFAIVYTLTSVLALLISASIVEYKRRNVPKEYRQRMRHKEIFKKTLLAGIFWVALASAYGVLTSKQTVPALNYQPMIWLSEQLPMLTEENPVRKGCVSWKEEYKYYYPIMCDMIIYNNNQNYYTPPLEPDNISGMGTLIYQRKSDEDKIRFIQSKISLRYPDVQVTGIMDETTKKRAVQWLNFQGKPISEEATQTEMFKAFNLIRESSNNSKKSKKHNVKKQKA